MLCPKCTADITDGLAVCPKCGCKIISEPPVAAPKRTSLIAVISFILAMLSFIVLTLIVGELPSVAAHLKITALGYVLQYSVIIAAIIAIILGAIAYKQIKSNRGALAGIDLAVVSILIAAITLVFTIILVTVTFPAYRQPTLQSSYTKSSTRLVTTWLEPYHVDVPPAVQNSASDDKEV
jgi:hypothetical protein